MTTEAALYKILFQDETLFRVASPEVVHKPADEIKTSPVSQPVLPSTPSVAAPLTAPAETKNATPFPALKHSILVLADEPGSSAINDSALTLLTNILKAVGHSIEEVDILNYSFLESKDARTVLVDKKTNYFITFGVPLVKLHLDLLLPPYTPKQIEGIWFLLADPLSVIENDIDLKKKLWLALRTMFPKD